MSFYYTEKDYIPKEGVVPETAMFQILKHYNTTQVAEALFTHQTYPLGQVPYMRNDKGTVITLPLQEEGNNKTYSKEELVKFVNNVKVGEEIVIPSFIIEGRTVVVLRTHIYSWRPRAHYMSFEFPEFTEGDL